MGNKAKGSHAAITAKVTSHFFGGSSQKAGAASGKGLPSGGSAAYNGKPMAFPNDNQGVNYTPPSKAGNRTR